MTSQLSAALHAAAAGIHPDEAATGLIIAACRNASPAHATPTGSSTIASPTSKPASSPPSPRPAGGPLMQVTFDMADAMELEQPLDFLAGWIKSDHDYLAPSLARYLGVEIKDLDEDCPGSLRLAGQ